MAGANFVSTPTSPQKLETNPCISNTKTYLNWFFDILQTRFYLYFPFDIDTVPLPQTPERNFVFHKIYMCADIVSIEMQSKPMEQ